MEKMNLGSVKIFLRKDYRGKEKQKYPVYIRIIIKKRKKDYSLGMFLD